VTLRTFLLISLGAVLGANARYLLSSFAATRWGTAFPWGTLLINVTGSFLIGLFLAVVAARYDNSLGARALLVTGFLGAYTTFSTFSFETVALGQRAAYLSAFTYALGSVILGVAAAILGMLLGNRIAG
jgi:CrcB protein